MGMIHTFLRSSLLGLLCTLSISAEGTVAATESREAIARRAVESIYLEGVLFETGQSELYASTYKFYCDCGTRPQELNPEYVLEYLFQSGESVKSACHVERALAWAPRNDQDVAHGWSALVPANRQGIGYRILRHGKVVSERRFPMAAGSIPMEVKEISPQALTWRIQADRAEIAVSYDEGKSWQVTSDMRGPSGRLTLPASQLSATPHPWVLLQGSIDGTMQYRVHVFGYPPPS